MKKIGGYYVALTALSLSGALPRGAKANDGWVDAPINIKVQVRNPSANIKSQVQDSAFLFAQFAALMQGNCGQVPPAEFKSAGSDERVGYLCFRSAGSCQQACVHTDSVRAGIFKVEAYR